MIRVLFICHGNICRSPMAEFIMRDLVSKRGLADGFAITSAAVSTEEIGNPVYPPAASVLRAHGVPVGGHAAHRVTADEFDAQDAVALMDASNMRILGRLLGGRRASTARLLMSYAGEDRDVADPWYTGDFERAYRDIGRGCRAMLDELCGKPD